METIKLVSLGLFVNSTHILMTTDDGFGVSNIYVVFGTIVTFAILEWRANRSKQ